MLCSLVLWRHNLQQSADQQASYLDTFQWINQHWQYLNISNIWEILTNKRNSKYKSMNIVMKISPRNDSQFWFQLHLSVKASKSTFPVSSTAYITCLLIGRILPWHHNYRVQSKGVKSTRLRGSTSQLFSQWFGLYFISISTNGDIIDFLSFNFQFSFGPRSHRSIRYTVFAIRYTLFSPPQTRFRYFHAPSLECRLWRRANRIAYSGYRIANTV